MASALNTLPRSLTSDALLVRAGQFAQASRQAALVLIALALPRLGVLPEGIGEWEGLLFTGYVLGFSWLTGTLQAYAIEIKRARSREQWFFDRRILLVVALLSLSLLTLAGLVHRPLFALLQFDAPPPGWPYFFVYLAVSWPALLLEQQLVVQNRPRTLLAFAALSHGGLALGLLLPLYLGYPLTVALRVLGIFSLLRALLIVLIATHQRCPSETSSDPATQKTDDNRTTSFLRLSLSLSLYAASGALVTAFDPWFVNYHYDGNEATFAIFRYGTREIPLLAALINGMIVVALPKLSENQTEGLAFLLRNARRLCHYVFPAALLLSVTAHWWWTLLFTATFADSLPLFRIFLFLIVSRLLFPVQVLATAGHARYLPAFAGLEFVVNLVLSLWLTPVFGLAGIVWATVITYTLDKLLLLYYTQRKTGITPEAYVPFRTLLPYTAALFLVWWWL